MIGAQKRDAVGQLVNFAVTEKYASFGSQNAGALEMVQVCIEGNFAESKNHFHTLQDGDLTRHMHRAVRYFVRCRLVVRRSTVHHSGDLCNVELLTIVSMERGRLRGKARGVQNAIQEVTRAVAGER